MLDLLSWKRTVPLRFRGCNLLLAEYFSKCVCVLNSLCCSHQLACTRESKKYMLHMEVYIVCGTSVAVYLGLLQRSRERKHCKPGKDGCKATNLQRNLVRGVVSSALQSCFVKMIKVQVAT